MADIDTKKLVEQAEALFRERGYYRDAKVTTTDAPVAEQYAAWVVIDAKTGAFVKDRYNLHAMFPIDKSKVKAAADERGWLCFEDFVDSEYTPTVAAYLADVAPKKVLALIERVEKLDRLLGEALGELHDTGGQFAMAAADRIEKEASS